jgi:hypothetical protein
MLPHLSSLLTFARGLNVPSVGLIMIGQRARLGWGTRRHPPRALRWLFINNQSAAND